MELYELIDLLNAVKQQAERFDAQTNGTCVTTITRGDDWWTLSIKHKIIVEDSIDINWSTYNRDFDTLHDLREHLQILSIGFALARYEEV